MNPEEEFRGGLKEFRGDIQTRGLDEEVKTSDFRGGIQRGIQRK